MLILGAVVDQQEQAGGGQALHQAIEERLGLGVDPVEVLEDQQEGLHLALPQEQAFEGVQGALAALRRIEGLPCGILHRHLQEGQEGRQGRPEGRIQREQPPGELLAHAPPVVAVLELKVGLEQVDDRQIRGGLAIGGRAAFQQEPALGARRMGELVEEAGLAHPGFPDDRHHLAVPRPGLLQGLVQGREFRLPPHEGRQPPRRKRLQARAGRAGAHQLAHLHGSGQPLDGHRAQGGDLDPSLRQPQGLGRQPNAPGGRELFHAGRQVRGLADGRVVHVQIVANGPHHHLAGVEANPDLHLDAMPAAHLLAVAADGLLHGERRIAGPHGMIFMGNRRPKQRHNAIAHDLVHGPFVAVHGRHHALQHRVEELARLLGVAVGQQLHRAFEIGKEHRDLLAFAFQRASEVRIFSARYGGV